MGLLAPMHQSRGLVTAAPFGKVVGEVVDISSDMVFSLRQLR